jgi:hypothetical protein
MPKKFTLKDIKTGFEPLEYYLQEVLNMGTGKEFVQTISNYMFMMEQDDVFYYKHVMSREYIKLKDGELIEGKLQKWRDWTTTA